VEFLFIKPTTCFVVYHDIAVTRQKLNFLAFSCVASFAFQNSLSSFQNPCRYLLILDALCRDFNPQIIYYSNKIKQLIRLYFSNFKVKLKMHNIRDSLLRKVLVNCVTRHVQIKTF